MGTFGTFSGVLTSTDLNARHGGSWRRVANQSISNATVTLISWDTEDADTDGFAVPTTSTITIPTGLGGIYAVTALVAYSSVTLNANIIYITTNGLSFASSVPTGLGAAQSVSIIVPIAAAGTITVSTGHNNGGALNATGTLYVTRLGA